MNAQHTQGPWAVTHDTDIIGTENDPENGCVGTVDVAHVYLRTVPGRTAANARLIASAPELKEAVERLLSWVRTGHQTRSEDVAFAQQALAKATGGEA